MSLLFNADLIAIANAVLKRMVRAGSWLLGAKRFFLVARYYDDGNNKLDANTQASPTRGAHPPKTCDHILSPPLIEP
jgi:hypothetical protein